MVFGFTRIVLAFFLTALLALSAILLWMSSESTKTALRYEQVDQVNTAHHLAQKKINALLKTDIDYLNEIGYDALRADPLAFLNRSHIGHVVFLEGVDGVGSYRVSGAYGEDLSLDGLQSPLRRNNRWTLVNIYDVWFLSYQMILTSENDRPVNVRVGISLNENSKLVNELKNASGAVLHGLATRGQLLSQSTSPDQRVSEILAQSMAQEGQVWSTLGNTFSAHKRPLVIEYGSNELLLISVVAPSGTISWKENFHVRTVQSLFIAFLLALIFTYILQRWTNRSLENLVFYAQDAQTDPKAAEYSGGVIKEINQAGFSVSKMAQELQLQKEYVSDLVDLSRSPVVAWDERGTITLFNQKARKLFDFSSREAVPEKIFEFIHTRQDFIAQKAFENGAKGLHSHGMETVIFADGQNHYIVWDVAPVFDVNGENRGAIAQGKDTTDHVIADRRLRLARQVFNNTVEAIMIMDDKGDIVEVNTAFCEITGYERTDMIGRHPRVMQSERHSDTLYDDIWKELTKSGQWRGEYWNVRKNAEDYPVMMSITPSRNTKGHLTNYVAIFSDITSTKADQEKLEQLAHFDPLTGLPNRILYQDRLKRSLARSKRDQGMMAVMFIDLDRFKQVNDSFGHGMGDLLLKEVSKRLEVSVREIDTVARQSGDEFTIILTDILSQDDIEMIAGRIVKSVGAPYFFEGHELFVSASVGIAVYPTDGETPSDLMRQADAAMYHAKEKGKNNYQFFDAQMNERAQEQLSLANQLRVALNRNQISPHYQLKMDIRTGRPIGLEALARWTDDFGTPISPAVFIPVAEEQGLIVRVGQSVLEQVCAQARMWKDMAFDFGSIAINLSAQQFRDRNLLVDIKTAIEDNRIDPTCLEVEITENMVMENVEGAIKIMNDLKDMGLKISIDDFGTGYSSLSYLKRFPVDTLKIDRSFVKDLPDDPEDAAIVSAIVSMAHNLDIEIVAEGVETKEQLEYLSSIGCNLVQGFYFAKPCAGGELPIIWSQAFDENKQEDAI